jgi:drug/metabolite transporter (DMT)-like permease
MSALCFGLIGPIGLKAFALASLSTVVGWRFLLAACVLWVLVAAQHRRAGVGRARWQPLVMGAALYATQSGLNLVALQLLPVGLTSLLLYTMPVMVVVVALLTGQESVRPAILVALVLAVGGVAVAVLGPGDGHVSTAGVLLDLGSAVLYTAYYFGMASLPPDTDRLAASAWVCTGAAASHIGFGLLTGRFDVTPPLAVLPWILAMALVCTVTALTLLMVGIETAGAPNASVVSCLEPILAVLLGAAFFADPFGPSQWLGTAGVVAAVVVLGRSSAASEPVADRIAG